MLTVAESGSDVKMMSRLESPSSKFNNEIVAVPENMASNMMLASMPPPLTPELPDRALNSPVMVLVPLSSAT